MNSLGVRLLYITLSPITYRKCVEVYITTCWCFNEQFECKVTLHYPLPYNLQKVCGSLQQHAGVSMNSLGVRLLYITLSPITYRKCVEVCNNMLVFQ